MDIRRTFPRHILSICGVLIVVYLAVMDCLLFYRIQTSKALSLQRKRNDDVEPRGWMYSPFPELSIPTFFTGHVTLYILRPAAEYFDHYTGMSQNIPIISPNVISVVHVIISIIGGVLIATGNLRMRRTGAVIYLVGAWLDLLDGVVYRSQHKLYKISEGRIWGRTIDHLCDEIAGFILFFGVLSYLLRDKWSTCRMYAMFVVVSFGLQLYFEMWARVKISGRFYNILQAPTSDPTRLVAQEQALHKYATFFIMLFWSFSLEYTLLLGIAIYLDKLWEFLLCVRYLGFAVLLTMYMSTRMYIKYLEKMVYNVES